MSILDVPLILETRRNHALEHATLHVLAHKYPGQPLVGHSNPTGFFIFGSVPTDDLQAAATQALTRLRAGERGLAIHAGCGTNLATTVLVAGTLAWLTLRGARSIFGRILRLPFAFSLALFGFFLSQPLGPLVQAKVTTEADPGEMEIVEVYPVMRGRLAAHRVVTR